MRLEDLQTPALLIRLDRVRANLARMRELLGGDVGRWRPHVKTSKIPEVLDLVLEAGVEHFKCATTREAAILLERAHAPIDVLVAMGHHGANRDRLAALARAHPRHRLSLLTEDASHAASTRATAPELGLFVDLDPGYGRSGIPLRDRERILATAAACEEQLVGWHCYDGHIHDGAPRDRQARCEAVYAELLAAVAPLGHGELEIVTSGTPTFPFALRHPGFFGRNHKVSPGTVVYWDERSAALGIDGFAPAALVLARVISAGAGRATCDAGSKAVDAAAGDPCAIVVDWPHLRAATPSEEHLPLRAESGSVPSLGALLQLVPRHVCPTVNLADEAVLLDGERVVGIVAVAARGHETRREPRTGLPSAVGGRRLGTK
jgi:D-serine deaminase-like pyridoxal phosphate-dependent protein